MNATISAVTLKPGDVMPKPKLPEIIRIGPIPFSVNIADDVLADTAGGNMKYESAAINISKKAPMYLQYEILVHEAVHAILMAIGEDDLSSNEPFVQRLSNCLADVLLRNSDLRKYINDVAKTLDK